MPNSVNGETYDRLEAMPGHLKIKILKNDTSGRYKKGEEGILVQNNFEKYDYQACLKGTVDYPPGFLGIKEGIKETTRLFYFYKEEIEILNTKE